MIEWSPVKGLDGVYEVSSDGRVRSLPRLVNHSRSGQVLRKGVELKPGFNPNGYLIVNLNNNGFVRMGLVHRLVAEAFLPEPTPEQRLVRHLNDNRLDNRVENLAWGTDKDNAQDAISNGRNKELNKTHCPQGHPYDEENTYISGKKKGRLCRACRAEHRKRCIAEGLPEGDHRHGTSAGYSLYRCKCDPCKEFRNAYERRLRKRRKNEKGV